MAGISRYEKIVLGLTAGFVLFTGGWFLASSRTAQPYTVTVQRQEELPARSEAAQPEKPETAKAPEERTRPDSLMEGEVIDLNTADVYDLCRLPGIGEKRAQAIIVWREENGPFQTVEELTNVSGIGPKILEGLEDYVTTGSE